MTRTNRLSQRQEREIRAVGREIEKARLAHRWSLREAASRAKTRRGTMNQQTWRRIELGYTNVGIGGVSQQVTYRPSAEVLTAMCEVVGLDAEEMCKRVGLEAVPAFRRGVETADELSALRQDAAALLERIEALEAATRAQAAESKPS